MQFKETVLHGVLFETLFDPKCVSKVTDRLLRRITPRIPPSHNIPMAVASPDDDEGITCCLSEFFPDSESDTMS